MRNVSDKSAFNQFPDGLSSVRSSRNKTLLPYDADQITHEEILTRDLLEPLFMRTVNVGVFAPLLFAYLGSSNVLVPYIEQSQWLVNRMTPIWPSLQPQYELVLRDLGVGHAASYGFLCAVLWTWPAICAVTFLRAHAKRRKEILPVSIMEIGQFLVLLPFAVLVLVFDQTKVTNLLFGFHADLWGFFYLRQGLVFGFTALVLAILIYAVGRIMINSIGRRVA
jgi:hypothetical protein